MPSMDILGWIVVGLFAGAISGALVGGRTARGCLPNVIIGVIGGILGGWLVTDRRDGLRPRASSVPSRAPSSGP